MPFKYLDRGVRCQIVKTKGESIVVREITLGQFIPGNSFIHKMDARSKIVLTIAYIIFIFLCKNFISLLIMSLFSILVILSTKISFMKYLKSLKAIMIIILITGIMNVFYGSGDIIWQWWIIKITYGGLINAAFVIIRISMLMMISSVLTYTTSPTDLTDGLEQLMKPLTFFHIKVHDIAMMMTIALRFIPVLLEETDKIMNAQKSRGADMESGSFINRIKSLLPVLIPLFVSSFRRAGDLATAMECRCYNGGINRTRMNILHFTYVDLISLISCILVFLAVIVSNIFFAAVI